MKSRLRILQLSLSSFFVIVTLVAILVPLAWDRFHSNYEISADLLGPLQGRSNSHTSRKPSDIKLLIETHANFRDKLVPHGSSNISVHVREHDNYVEPLSLAGQSTTTQYSAARSLALIQPAISFQLYGSWMSTSTMCAMTLTQNLISPVEKSRNNITMQAKLGLPVQCGVEISVPAR